MEKWRRLSAGVRASWLVVGLIGAAACNVNDNGLEGDAGPGHGGTSGYGGAHGLGGTGAGLGGAQLPGAGTGGAVGRGGSPTVSGGSEGGGGRRPTGGATSAVGGRAGAGGAVGRGGAPGTGGRAGVGGAVMGRGGAGMGGVMMAGGGSPGMGGRPGMGGMMTGAGGARTADAGVTDARVTCHAAGTLQVTHTGSSAYVIDGASNPDLTFCRGMTYVFAVDTPGHPFYIKTVQGTGADHAYENGVSGNGTTTGDVTFDVPAAAPDTLFYDCSVHPAMSGTIHIVS